MEAVEPVAVVSSGVAVAVAVKILTIQEVVIQVARKTITTITKPTIKLDLQDQRSAVSESQILDLAKTRNIIERYDNSTSFFISLRSNDQ